MVFSSWGLSVLAALLRSPGYRAAGIGLVDARSGAPASVMQAIIRESVGPIRNAIIGGMTRPLQVPFPNFDAREIEELRRRHAGDQEELARGFQALQEERDPRSACLRALVRPLVGLALRRFEERYVGRRWPGRRLEDVLSRTTVSVAR